MSFVISKVLMKKTYIENSLVIKKFFSKPLKNEINSCIYNQTANFIILILLKNQKN